MHFDDFELDPRCLDALKRQGITKPTPVQEQAIPYGLEGRDVLAVAQTGTGKTLAFALPALTRLAAQKPTHNRMLILTPTRELARQIHDVVTPLSRALKFRTAEVYGGVGMHPQTKALRRGMDVVIATPGRLLDHMQQGNARFDGLSILVLDEADRMLDMGFLPDIRRIIEELPKERQTMMFSATFPENIEKMTHEFQRNPKRIEIGAVSTPVEAVTQGMYGVEQNRKIDLLSDVLSEDDVESAIVFIRTKYRTDRIAKQLRAKGFRAEAIHGGRSQGQRQRALDQFRSGRCKILVATDVAARGIDVQGVTHVVNFDVPGQFEDYVHRIGRTARASATGHAFTFVTPEDTQELRQIERGLGRDLERLPWEHEIQISTQHSGPKRGPSRNGGANRGGGYGGRGRNSSYRGSNGTSGGGRGNGGSYRGAKRDDSGSYRGKDKHEGGGYRGNRSNDGGSYHGTHQSDGDSGGYRGKRHDNGGYRGAKSPDAGGSTRSQANGDGGYRGKNSSGGGGSKNSYRGANNGSNQGGAKRKPSRRRTPAGAR